MQFLFLRIRKLPITNDGYATIATAHYDVAYIPVHASNPALAVLTRRWWHPQQDATDEVLSADGGSN